MSIWNLHHSDLQRGGPEGVIGEIPMDGLSTRGGNAGDLQGANDWENLAVGVV